MMDDRDLARLDKLTASLDRVGDQLVELSALLQTLADVAVGQARAQNIAITRSAPDAALPPAPVPPVP